MWQLLTVACGPTGGGGYCPLQAAVWAREKLADLGHAVPAAHWAMRAPWESHRESVCLGPGVRTPGPAGSPPGLAARACLHSQAVNAAAWESTVSSFVLGVGVMVH